MFSEGGWFISKVSGSHMCYTWTITTKHQVKYHKVGSGKDRETVFKRASVQDAFYVNSELNAMT